METITYNLQGINKASSDFYNKLYEFTNYIIKSEDFNVSIFINKYINFWKHETKHNSTHPLQCFLELLSLGVLLNEHSKKAFRSNKLARTVAKKLYSLRKKNTILKPLIDKIRGIHSYIFLAKEGTEGFTSSPDELRVFIDWLDATGEYKEEATVFTKWAYYFDNLSAAEFMSFIKVAEYLGNHFKVISTEKLGIYTHNINSFIKNDLPTHRFKENYIFCGKNRVEYHLNMVGAEILNRILKDDFIRTSKKILLLPTCMCQPDKGMCKSEISNNKVYCTGCSASCKVNIYRKYCNQRDISVNLLPHSSTFSKYLKEWQSKKTTGLIGVACVSNLLTGGYEMKKLNIPSQCIFLDYCGCKKHWSKKGITTDIDISQLDKMLKTQKETSHSKV